ncbi:hypothetical protein PAHAL_9G232100 [Panicum hallii]|jgi:hypothetical protein|uniref:Uncharacterized protein n=1 Tax=Panicum hallii TaxID=206008 RepID=A0A2S3ILU0_9POAL|nr:hypothetical protein PAHAL_9G232100 [Panicum hallii]
MPAARVVPYLLPSASTSISHARQPSLLHPQLQGPRVGDPTSKRADGVPPICSSAPPPATSFSTLSPPPALFVLPDHDPAFPRRANCRLLHGRLLERNVSPRTTHTYGRGLAHGHTAARLRPFRRTSDFLAELQSYVRRRRRRK